jgi:hypothetical protein
MYTHKAPDIYHSLLFTINHCHCQIHFHPFPLPSTSASLELIGRQISLHCLSTKISKMCPKKSAPAPNTHHHRNRTPLPYLFLQCFHLCLPHHDIALFTFGPGSRQSRVWRCIDGWRRLFSTIAIVDLQGATVNNKTTTQQEHNNKNGVGLKQQDDQESNHNPQPTTHTPHPTTHTPQPILPYLRAAFNCISNSFTRSMAKDPPAPPANTFFSNS